ncbi:BC1872 family protein [Metabacillus fastidiosus]|uniref:BC1872 family protein n=1 Tax=Metabacillus fastidiosus TaxID=1458 RepID=UPI003D2AD144
MNNQKINKLVAEQIMGWKVKKAMDGVTEYYDNGSFCEGKWVEDLGLREKDNVDVFKPSERIQDAWLVVQKFQYHKVEMDAGHYYCTLANDGPFFDGDSETAPMAICLAALKTVGVEVD